MAPAPALLVAQKGPRTTKRKVKKLHYFDNKFANMGPAAGDFAPGPRSP